MLHDLEQAARREVGVDRDDGVQVVGLLRPDRLGLVDARHRHDRDARRRGESVDGVLEVGQPVTEVGAEPEVRAPERHRSTRTAT